MSVNSSQDLIDLLISESKRHCSRDSPHISAYHHMLSSPGWMASLDIQLPFVAGFHSISAGSISDVVHSSLVTVCRRRY